jgi:hypothetical protein
MGQRINERARRRRKRFVYSFLTFVDGVAKPPIQIGAQNPASACADAAVQGTRL